MKNTVEMILDEIKGKCDKETYMKVLLLANGGHHCEETCGHVVSSLKYVNGSPVDAGVETDSLYEIVRTRCTELGLDIEFTKWDSMAYVSRAFAIHWSTVSGDLETAVTIAVEDMAEAFGG